MNYPNSRSSIFFPAGVGVLAAIGGGVAVAQTVAPESTASAAAETYRLVQVGSNALPALLEQEGDCTEQVINGTLTLDAGTWVLQTTERETCGQTVDEEEERSEGSYTTEGATLRFCDNDADDHDDDAEDSYDPAGDIDLEDLASGTISGNSVSITLDDGATVLRFDR